MKKSIVLIVFLSFCSQASTEEMSNVTSTETTASKTQSEEIIENDDTTTTTIEVVQLDTFSNIDYVIDNEKSVVSYLAPKDFLNANLEIVRGSTNKIIGGFKLSLESCDLADSCLIITNLLISVDLTTLNSGNSIRDNQIRNNWLESNLFPSAIYKIEELILPNNDFDSKIDETIVGILTIKNIEVSVPFSVTAYMENDEIKIFGVTEIDTTWFGFDAPTKFNAWEVLNPIGIEVDLVAKRK